MGMNEIRGRIQRFRQEYLETAEGREHLKKATDEAIEVQAIYQQLRKKQQADEDITDETLKRLLPHSNTQGNRERGARISTWPCITKDVRMWFEAANWKQPSEWPAAAEWLLDLVEAGSSEDWTQWQSLAVQPIQKGFACGFITPIVHCLNNNLPVINSKVVKTFQQVAKELGLDQKISAALEEYPENQKLIVALVAKLQDAGIDALIGWDIYCHWNVAKKLGGKDGPVVPSVIVGDGKKTKEVLSEVVQELQEAQHDTKNPDRFEAAVAAAFQVMGFETEHIGGPGEADVVARAMLGDESYSLVADAKTCQPGTTRSNINYDPLKKHQEQHEAEFAIVVAPAFSQGDTIAHADSHGIGLLTTERLTAFVEEALQNGISLYDLKEVVSMQGLIHATPQQYRANRDDLTNAAIAVLEVFDIHQRGDDSSTGLTPNSAFLLLKGGGAKVPENHVEAAMDLLANPVVGVLAKREEGFVLALPPSAAHARVESFGKALRAIGKDSEEEAD